MYSRLRRLLSLNGSAHAAVILVLAAVLAACGTPGSDNKPTAKNPSDVSTELPTGPVTLKVMLESNFVDGMKSLGAEFTKQHPNVTFDFQSDEFTNLLQNGQKLISSPDAPDLVRFPVVSAAARNGILVNLDPYAAAYGWDKWPQGVLGQVRVNEDGSRGTGSLYSLGIGYSVTGVFYNKQLAAKVGMTQPPRTIDELVGYMAAAKSMGILPVQAGNKDAGLALALQALQNQFGDVDKLYDWLYDVPGATYDLPSSLRAAQEIQEWADEGYFPKDTNAVDYATMLGHFIAGDGLFLFLGDWESANLEKQTKGNTGFFLMPPEQAGANRFAMSAPNTYVIPKTAKHADVAAYFLNWIHTNPTARQMVKDVTGLSPGGPADLPVPDAPAGSLRLETLEASGQLAREDGAIDFLGNSAPGLLGAAITPNIQLLVTDRITPQAFVDAIQKEYQTELDR